MVKVTHTPGPWHVGRKFEVGPRSDADDQSNGMVLPIADVYGENREADARLIAAAPELVKALQEAIELQATTYGDATALHLAMVVWINKARTVLATAKSEPR